MPTKSRSVPIQEVPEYLDASDALAVAICHYYNTRSPIKIPAGKAASSWEDFVRMNADRIRQ